MDNLYGAPLFASHYLRRFGYGREDLVVVSPDVGSVARARSFAMKMGLGLAIVDKRRQKANSSEVMNIIGDVRASTSSCWTIWWIRAAPCARNPMARLRP